VCGGAKTRERRHGSGGLALGQVERGQLGGDGAVRVREFLALASC